MIDFNKKWENDLNEGQKGERVVSEYFTKRWGLTGITFNDNSDYDFMGSKDDRTILFEVKTDRYEHFKGVNTYNMFIEVSCSGKPSGILTSKAEQFVYYYPDLEEMFIIPMTELRLLCILEDLKLTEQSGDKGKTKGYLLHRNLFRDRFKVFQVIKDTTIWEDKK